MLHKAIAIDMMMVIKTKHIEPKINEARVNKTEMDNSK